VRNRRQIIENADINESTLQGPDAAGAALLACRPLLIQGTPMTITLAHVAPLVALLAGILILIMPRLLNFIVAIYLIFVGVTGLWPHLLH
jgi:hypothetical protein